MTHCYIICMIPFSPGLKKEKKKKRLFFSSLRKNRHARENMSYHYIYYCIYALQAASIIYIYNTTTVLSVCSESVVCGWSIIVWYNNSKLLTSVGYSVCIYSYIIRRAHTRSHQKHDTFVLFLVWRTTRSEEIQRIQEKNNHQLFFFLVWKKKKKKNGTHGSAAAVLGEILLRLDI